MDKPETLMAVAPTRQSPPKLTYTISEAVAVSGLSKSSINRRVADGTIELRKVGGRRLIIAPALHRLLGVA